MSNRDYLLVIVSVDRPSESTKTGGIFSRATTKQYATGWEAVFGKQKTDGEIAHSKSLN